MFIIFSGTPLPLTQLKPSVFISAQYILLLSFRKYSFSSCDIENQLYKRDFRCKKNVNTPNENTSVLCRKIQSTEITNKASCT